MARTWLTIRIDLVEGHGEHLWPRPGRLFAAARSHTFAQLADAIDDAFARWDRAHLHEFALADGTRLTTPYTDWEELGPALDDSKVRLSRLEPEEQFVYVFDFGDDWAHVCSVGPGASTPLEWLGPVPDRPMAHLAGAPSPTRTAAAGTPTMATRGNLATPALRTSRRCDRIGPGCRSQTLSP